MVNNARQGMHNITQRVMRNGERVADLTGVETKTNTILNNENANAQGARANTEKCRTREKQGANTNVNC